MFKIVDCITIVSDSYSRTVFDTSSWRKVTSSLTYLTIA